MLEATFTPTFWNTYKFEDESNENNWETEKDNFKECLVSIKEQIFQSLNSSVFMGEYVSDDNLDDTIISILNKIDSIPQILANIEIQEFVIETFHKNFIDVFKYCLKSYHSFFIGFRNIFDIDNREFVLIFNPEINGLLENHKFDDLSVQLIRFFIANLSLADLDHKLNPDVTDFNTLLQLSETSVSNKFGANKLSFLLREKCNYLICKWVLRKQHLNSHEVFYLRDNKEVKANIDDFKNSLFSSWKNYIESHYEISNNWKSEIQSDFDKIKRQNIELLSLKQLHRLIKYYKDVNKNLENLSTVVKEIERRFTLNQNSNKRDLFYSYSVAYIYGLNNE